VTDASPVGQPDRMCSAVVMFRCAARCSTSETCHTRCRCTQVLALTDQCTVTY